MKMEKISETQIRFTLNNSDLLEREIKISELAYGSEKAQELFRDMMEKAFDKYGFEVDNVPLMIEAVPLSQESIMIIVTKVDNPSEIDDKLSYFTNKNVRKFKKKNDSTTSETQETTIHDDIEEILDDITDDAIKKLSTKRPSSTIYVFKELDDVINASKRVDTLCQSSNSLFKDNKSKKYILFMNFQSKSDNNIMDEIFTEYGEKIKTTNLTESYLYEHAEVLIKDKAVQVFSQYM